MHCTAMKMHDEDGNLMTMMEDMQLVLERRERRTEMDKRHEMEKRGGEMS